MIHREKAGVEWLEFSLLQPYPEVVHGVFLRHGLDMGDKANRKRACGALGLSSYVFCEQVHGSEVFRMEDDPPMTPYDGLVTERKEVGLLIKHADCQAAIFYDPVKQVIGNVHCGWRGNVQNIYQKTVERFSCLFDSSPEDLLVCISPSLGPLSAEFVNHERELPKAFAPFQVKPNYFDFWAISRMQLEAAGVLPDHIEVAGLCTFAEEAKFFSHRRDKKTGRNATVISLMPSIKKSS
ncbi:MAG: Laccase domain protein YfiH [Chlamydiae bacterium]|nr:Laccase domain protein YfiH [Chlamydiota bacterium]